MEYPVRINKYLALRGFCSRREADDLIARGKVKVNGKVAKLGRMIAETDEVSVGGQRKKLVYYALNKPRGIITHSPQQGEKSIAEVCKFPEKVFPLGRLDKASRGLIILTNDGRATDKLLNPKFAHEKEYMVRVHKPVSESFLKCLGRGVVLDDGTRTKPCQVKKRGDASFMIILTEGKKRQIRRMCEILGYQVLDLNRVRIMNIQLADLRPGAYRKIAGTELMEFLAGIHLEISCAKDQSE